MADTNTNREIFSAALSAHVSELILFWHGTGLSCRWLVPDSEHCYVDDTIIGHLKAFDPDSIASLHYHFTIEGVVDTIVPEPAFTYWGNLPPLEHLHWSVRAINEFGFASRSTIHGDFFTRGGIGEAGVTGAVTTSTAAIGTGNYEFSVNATVLDSLGNTVLSKDIESNSLAILHKHCSNANTLDVKLGVVGG